MKLRRWYTDRRANLLIALLVLSALFLIQKTGMFQSLAGTMDGEGSAALAAGVQDTALARSTPVRLQVQTAAGRCGVQYDQARVEELYAQGLGDLLTQSVNAMGEPKTVSRQDLDQALAQGDPWVFYDFLYDLSFTARNGQEEQARFFLVTSRSGQADQVYYYNEETGEFCAGRVREADVVLPILLEELVPNDARFAFEVPTLSEILSPYMLVLPQPPLTPVYQAENPLAGLDETGREALLEALDFNARASAIYQAAGGTVIQEGSDTLRLQTDGRLIYHSTQQAQSRYQALSTREKDLRIRAEELLQAALSGRGGQGEMLCQSVQTQADGSVELTYCYMLGGAQVLLREEGWGAKFTFEGKDLTEFTISLRTYTQTDQAQRALPERQAAAAAAAGGQAGKELQLCYVDGGSDGQVAASWQVREKP